MINIDKLVKKPFQSTQSDLVKYNGQDFEIIRELEKGKEYDFEGTYMFEIKFSNGDIIHAFDDEIVEKSSVHDDFHK